MGCAPTVGAVVGSAGFVTGGTTAALALLLAGSALLSTAEQQVTRFRDPEIIESSGLIARDNTFVTTNDSGDTGRVFIVDQRTGETLDEIGWADDPDDVEALAPGPGSAVWVGDIGDNNADRDEVTVALVDLAGGPTTSFDLRYPGGAADAEALLSHPQTGQLFIATKSVFGGEFLAAPTRLRETKAHRMSALGRVAGLITDGAFFPDGRHFIVRNYSSAFVYAYPTLDLVGEFALPAQEQGEGLAIAGDSSVYLSSEGIEAPIVLVDLPPEISESMTAANTLAAEPQTQASDPGSAPGSGDPPSDATGDPRRTWVIVGCVLVMLAAAITARKARQGRARGR